MGMFQGADVEDILIGLTKFASCSAFSGVFVAIAGQPAVQMGRMGDVGRRVGMALTIMSFGALAGPPISGAILDHSGGFKSVGYYAGKSILFDGKRIALSVLIFI